MGKRGRRFDLKYAFAFLGSVIFQSTAVEAGSVENGAVLDRFLKFCLDTDASYTEVTSAASEAGLRPVGGSHLANLQGDNRFDEAGWWIDEAKGEVLSVFKTGKHLVEGCAFGSIEPITDLNKALAFYDLRPDTSNRAGTYTIKKGGNILLVEVTQQVISGVTFHVSTIADVPDFWPR